MLGKWDKQRVKLAIRMLSILTQEASNGLIKVEEGEAECIHVTCPASHFFFDFCVTRLGSWIKNNMELGILFHVIKLFPSSPLPILDIHVVAHILSTWPLGVTLEVGICLSWDWDLESD